MKYLLLTCLCAISLLAANAQKPAGPAIYDPTANAEKDIANALAKAAKEHKHVLLQMGGNWCHWCIAFTSFIKDDPKTDSIVKANYVIYHLNYSPENKNEAIFAKYGYPQRFGFPVLVVLDAKGNRLNTQNTAYLEENAGYNRQKVNEFLTNWSPAALLPPGY